MRFPRKRGATQNIVRIFIPKNDVTTGAGLSTLTSASTNLTIVWQRTLGSAVSYTGANIASCTPGTWADAGSGKIGFAPVDTTAFPGLYELQFSDTGTVAFGSQDASDSVVVNIYEATTTALKIGPNMVLIPLVPWDYQDGVRMGLTGLANAVPGAAGGLFIAGTNAPVTITGSGDALTLTSTAANGCGLNATGNGTGDGMRLTGGASAGGDGLQATAGGGVDVRGNITGNLSGSVGSLTGYVAPTNLSAADIAAGVWRDTVAGDFTVADSVGKSVMNGIALGTGLTVNAVTTAITLPTIPTDWISATGIAAGALNSKGDWNVGKTGYTVSTVSDKTGYSLSQTFPDNFAVMDIASDGSVATSLTSGERESIADTLLDRDMATGIDSGSPTVRTVRQALRFLRNKISIAGGTLTITKEDDSTESWTAAVTTDANALPIVSSDPAS